MLTVGFVGAGLMGWAHALGVQSLIRSGLVDASVAAVHDIDPARAAGFAEANGARAVPSAADVVRSCDVLWVCTPTAAHRAVVEEAAGRGKAVFCEKPLAPDLAGAEAMARAVTEAAVPAQVGLVLRAAPVWRALRSLLASGTLGAPMTVVLRDDQYFPVQGLYRSSWRADAAVAGGGCLIEHSIHDVDILRHCLGEVTDVACRTADFSGHPGVEDLAVVTMAFESGATAEVVSIWHDVVSRPSTRRVEVFCRDGVVWLENEFVGPLHVQTSEGAEVRPCPWPEWVEALPLGEGEVGLALRSYVEADGAFLDAVSGGHAPEPSFDEAVVAHRIVDAAYRSAGDRGAPVALRR